MDSASILIVDTNGPGRADLAETLRETGCMVVDCGTAEEARESMTVCLFDLVLLDENVKGLTPVQLLDFFQERDLDTFVIVTSDHPEWDQAMDWVISGSFAFLPKPIDLTRLRHVIQKGLDNKEAFHEVVTLAQVLKKTNAELVREKNALKTKTEELAFLYDLESRLSSTLEGTEIADEVSNAVTRMTDARLVAILTDFNFDPEPRVYLNQALSEEGAGALGRNLFQQLRAGAPSSPIRILPLGGKERPLKQRPRNEVILPLIAAGNSCGFLGVYFSRPTDLGEDRLMLLKNTALMTARALVNAHRHERAVHLADHDALTGLYNRRAFDDILNREIQRKLRYGVDTALIIMDLDHFKSVNDTYGHEAGDRVLKTVAEVIQKLIRASDCAARIGGEEFAILLPNATQQDALVLAQRLHQTLENTLIPIRGRTLKQSVSQGLADTAGQTLTPHAGDLVRTADRAMYLAKKQGRNTICLARDLTGIDNTPRKDPLYVCR